MGGTWLEGLRGSTASGRTIRSRRQPDLGRPDCRLAHPAHDRWAGGLLRHRAHSRRSRRLQLVFNNAAGSVLIIMLMHAANNTISGSYFSSMFAGADSIRQSWLLAA